MCGVAVIVRRRRQPAMSTQPVYTVMIPTPSATLSGKSESMGVRTPVASPTVCQELSVSHLHLSYLSYALIGSTGLFLCSTLFLMVVVIILARKARAYKKKLGAQAVAKRKDASYWITENELDTPRVSSSTPNLSDWSSPPLARQVRTFFNPPLERDFHPFGTIGDRNNLVPSASMAPLVPPNQEQLVVKKSASHSDLTALPDHRSKIQLRPLPPSPPSMPKKSPSPSTGEETPKPMPRKKKKKHKKVPSPALLEISSGETDLSLSMDLQYGNLHKLSSAEISPAQRRKPSAYTTINLKLRDEPSHYETVDLRTK